MIITNSDETTMVFTDNVSVITINHYNEIVVYANNASYTLESYSCASEAQKNINKMLDAYSNGRDKVKLSRGL